MGYWQHIYRDPSPEEWRNFYERTGIVDMSSRISKKHEHLEGGAKLEAAALDVISEVFGQKMADGVKELRDNDNTERVD